MKLIRTIVFSIVFLTSFRVLTSAQVAFSESNTTNMTINGGVVPPFVLISVKDSISLQPMPGASVFVSGNRADTLKFATNKNGFTENIANRYMKDTISVHVSFLGYKPVIFRHAVSKPYVNINVKLQEDPQQINSIIITDKAVAMVIRGDTTIYNAAAFKTMRGDRLRSLLKQLPGVEVKGDDVYAQGRKISRIMVNGTTLFNRDVKSAMDMITSEEVTKIRLYDQHNPDRLIERDTLGRKEKVLDVATRNPKILALEGIMSLAAGGYTDENIDGKPELIGGASGIYRKFEMDKPQVTIMAEADHNTHNALQGSTVRPRNAILANGTVGQAVSRKFNYNNMFSFNYESEENEKRTEDIYNPNELYTHRTVDSKNFSGKETMQAQYLGDISLNMKNRGKLNFKLIGSYNQNIGKASNYLHSLIDGKGNLTDVSSYEKSDQGSVRFDIGYTHLFKKRGRRLSAEASYFGNFGGGNGWRLDTLSASSAPQWIINDAKSRANNSRMNLIYVEPLRRNLFMNLSYKVSADFSKHKRIATDNFTGLRDVLNTFDYTNRNITNTVNLSFRYKYKKLEIKAGADFNNSAQLRKESFPDRFEYPVVFRRLSPQLNVNLDKSVFKLTLGYNESDVIPSVEQLRGVINDYSPFFLTAGNPDLKQTIRRRTSLNMSYSDIASAATWKLEADYEECSNYIANKITYFSTDTMLEKYGYTAPAGSQLSTPVNVNGCRFLSTILSCHFKTLKLNSTFMPSVIYTFGQTPYFTGDVLHGNTNHNLGLRMTYISGFSEHIQIGFSYSGNVGRHMGDGKKLYDSMNHNIGLSPRFNFLKRMWLTASAGYNLNLTTTGYRYEAIPTSIKFSCKLGKKDEFEIGLECNDIINQNRSSSVSVFDEYIRYQYDRIFGRNILLTFTYNFLK